MVEFSDYVIFVDESGDHSLTKIDSQYPVFALAFCIFKKDEYIGSLVPRMQRFKFDWFGHDTVVLHEHEIRKQTGPFHILTKLSVRERFHDELNSIFIDAPMTIIGAVIHKLRHRAQYVAPMNPYDLALVFCLERAFEFLRVRGQDQKRTFAVFEARGGKNRELAGRYGREDQELELAFRRIVQGAHQFQRVLMPVFDIQIVSKQSNSIGLQIADLVARPLGLSVLRPNQQNRAMEIVRPKLWQGDGARLVQPGLRIFPD